MASNDICDSPALGLDLPAGDTPCDTTGTTTLCSPNACCNLLHFLAEGEGTSFVLSYGGPFPVQVHPTSGTDFECEGGCCERLTPLPLITAPFNDIVCVPGPISPGTYLIFVTGTLLVYDVSKTINPGARVSTLFYPDCANPDINTAQLVTDCIVPCTGTDTLISRRKWECCCQAMVYSPGCNPGIQILATQGCEQTGGDTPVTGDIFLTNVQIQMIQLSSRDLVNCNSNPQVSTFIVGGCNVV